MTKSDRVEINFKGKQVKVNAVRIEYKDIIAAGKIIKLAGVKIEWDDEVEDPEFLIDALKRTGFPADIFTFVQKYPETKPKYQYFMEWEAVAAMHVVSFHDWWKNLPKKTRQNIRNTEKNGVVAKLVDFDDELVKGILDIYNDTPVRQGRPFWHYGKDFNTVKRENATYLDRCDFIGAYRNDELIGFIKLVYSGKIAYPMQIISKIEHRDDILKPTSLLVAKAVELCEKKNIPYFTYGFWDEGSLSEFKRRNGFEKVLLPRYYVPLNIKGKVAIRMNLHHGIKGLLTEKMKFYLKNVRNKWYSTLHKTKSAHEGKKGLPKSGIQVH